MEMKGLTSSTLDPSGSGPARKVYHLTDEGHEVLSMWAAQLQETANVFAKFAERYGKLSK
jgi:PadR family transcriptional regulator PadR